MVDIRALVLSQTLHQVMTMCILAMGEMHCRQLGSQGDSAAVAKLLTLQGVQSVAVNTLPAPATESVECCLHLLQSLGQSKTVAEGIQSVRGMYRSGTVVYGLILHKAAAK